MRKLILLCVTLMIISSIPTAMAAITVDGYKGAGEWDEDWAFAQYEASTYNNSGPFGDRLVIRQGLYEGPYQTNLWYDTDPKDDSGTSFDDSMATLGDSSGFDIGNIYAHYDPLTDTVYGLTEVYGIPGDLDGNGNVATVAPADTAGVAGPAGTGLGETEYWRLRMIQPSTDTTTSITLINNDWEITGNGLVYSDISARFSSDQANSVYEISLSNLSKHYTILPGTVLAMELIAGSSADVPGEDTAIVFIRIPNPDIMITKYVMDMDGDWQDANTPLGAPTLANGSTVHWKYVIKNIGDEPLVNVAVTDDKVGPIDSGISLAINEERTLLKDGQVPLACPYVDGNYYKNVGTVTGIGAVSGIPVTDNDPAHYVCEKEYVPILTPAGLMVLIGTLGMIGILGLKRRD